MTRQRHIKNKGLLLVILTMMGLFLLTSCAGIQRGYHNVVMKGSIIETTDDGLFLCIGKKDGASVGQELDVYKISTTYQPKSPPIFKREKTGKVRITEIVDEHFAKATIISGKAEKHDVVELE